MPAVVFARRLGQDVAPAVPGMQHPVRLFRSITYHPTVHFFFQAPRVPKAGSATDRWSSLPLSMEMQAHFPGPRIVPPPMHLAADNRFPQRPPVHPEE